MYREILWGPCLKEALHICQKIIYPYIESILFGASSKNNIVQTADYIREFDNRNSHQKLVGA